MRRNRAAFILNATVSIALLGLIAAVALVVKAPSPPGIAEFAPQAARPITKAPLNQSSNNGSSNGTCVTGTACPSHSPSPKPSVIDDVKQVIKGVPSSLQCYTWPDGSVTQTFDPQSPPCVANWPDADKGNGGVTSQGVTSTAIRVAVPRHKGASSIPDWAPFVNFLNTRYQLYGRKIELVPFDSDQLSNNGGEYENPNVQHADAVTAVSLKTFAAMDFMDSSSTSTGNGATLPIYVDTLAKGHVVALTGGFYAPQMSSAQMQKNAPYAWSYYPALGDLVQEAAVVACRQLVGHPASHAADYATKMRKFGLVLPDSSSSGGDIPGLDAALSTLAACGVSNPPIAYYNIAGNSTLNAKLSQLKQQGVTTVIYLPSNVLPSPAPMTAASQSQYRPEWLVMASQIFMAANVSSAPATESRSSFGITVINKLPQLSAMPWFVASVQAGSTPPSGPGMASADPAYHELMMLAAGVQMAGPHLTPQTFAQAMHSTDFPNPGGGSAPSYQSTVGFPGVQTSMVRDFAGWWLEPSTTEADVIHQGLTQAGDDWQALCWTELGTRHRGESWPSTDAFRKGSCR